MSTDLDGDMAPFGIEDMKGVVVDLGHGLFAFEMMGAGDLPYRGLGARPPRMRNNPWVILVLARYSSAMSCLRSPTGQSMTGISCALA